MSDSQRNANRQNSKKSTGPITDEGKAASSHNSFRHGLASIAVTMLSFEDPQDYMDLGDAMRAEHKPITVTEDALVGKMIQSLWLSARAAKLQQALFLEPQSKRLDLDLYMRYQQMHDRTFSKCLSDLIKLRKEARDSQNGFVQQAQKTEYHETRIRAMNTRAEATEHAIAYQKVRNTRYFAAGSPTPPIA